MVSIALCDDEEKFLDFYEHKISEISKKINLSYEIIRFNNGESLLFYLEDNPNKFQIIFLDIITGGINGIETALEIRKSNKLSKIIFLTSSPSFVYNAFDANASNYLLKDIHDNKFEEVFVSTVKELNSSLSNDIIKFKSNNLDTIFLLNEITYFESYKRLVIVHMSNNEKHEFYYKLSDLTNELENKNYILVHRSYLVNMQYIKKISSDNITLKTNVSIPISRNLRNDVKDRFMKYLNK